MQILLLLQEQDVEETHGLGKKPSSRVQSNQQVTADTDRFSLFFFFIYGWLPFHHWLPLYDVEPTPELLIYDNYTLLLKLPSCQYYSSPISHLPYLSVFSCIVRMHVILCN